MAHLKSLIEHPPGSFQMLLPEIGMTTPFTGSFYSVVEKTFEVIKANQWLAEKHRWPTSQAGVEEMVESYNVARMIAGGWFSFLQEETDYTAPAYALPPPDEKKNRWGAVAGVKRVAAGVAVLIEWLGNSGKPVAPQLAEKRATLCAACPKNDGGDFKAFFTKPIADRIKLQLEMKHDLQLRTSKDEQLTVCSGCDCPLPLKVWTPLEHILSHTSQETMTKLDPRCWVLAKDA